MCPAWQPLPCWSIPVLGALESRHGGLEPSPLLTWEPPGTRRCVGLSQLPLPAQELYPPRVALEVS